MIHARKGSGTAGYRIGIGIGVIAVVIVLAAVAAGVAAVEFEVPWKGIAVLVCAVLAAVWTRLRDR
jgi:hypothetical protein